MAAKPQLLHGFGAALKFMCPVATSGGLPVQVSMPLSSLVTDLPADTNEVLYFCML